MSRIVRSDCPWCDGKKAKLAPEKHVLRCTSCKKERPAPAYLTGGSA